MERVRTTISLPKDVHDIFKKMAEVGSVSVSRCMGDWLADTSEGAQVVAQKMQQARESPKVLMREIEAFSAGLAEETATVLQALRQSSRSAGHGQRASGGRGSAPAHQKAPSSNTGLKSPPKKPLNSKSLNKSKG